MNQQILWGITSIIAGFAVLWYVSKKPVKGSDIGLGQAKGYFSGAGFIIMGIIMIVKAIIKIYK